jgi:glycosyltransferase involved in cell wall biosynthesis
MKFSVIMPSLLADYPGAAVNRHKTLIRAIESVLAQSFQDFELIVVADGCELTRHIMKTNYDDNPKIKYGIVPRAALFSNGARNTAIDIAEGEYIIYIDNDDKWGPDHLKIFNDQLSGEDWVYADDWTVDQLLLRDSGEVKWIRRDTDMTQYGKCGTSNICHARRLDLRWKEAGYGHDYHFIQQLLKFPNHKHIEAGQYYVCHFHGGYKV